MSATSMNTIARAVPRILSPRIDHFAQCAFNLYNYTLYLQQQNNRFDAETSIARVSIFDIRYVFVYIEWTNSASDILFGTRCICN